MSGDSTLGHLDDDKVDLIGERWAVTYSTILQKKCKSFHSGNILLHVDRRRLVLLDAEGTTVDAKVIPPDFSISMDMSLEFPCHLVNVVEQISCLSATDHSYLEVL
jgi:predicted benzoate:H+ symporter BenE